VRIIISARHHTGVSTQIIKGCVMITITHEILNRIAAAVGLDSTALTPLGGGREDSDGITYSFPHPSGVRVLKILDIPAGSTSKVSAADGLARLDERLKYAHFLGENGVDIVYPIEQTGGKLVISVPDEGHLFAAYIMEKASGHHPPPEEWSPTFHYQWGRTVGRLHRVTQGYPLWQHSIDQQGKSFLGWREEWQSFYDQCADAEIKAAWAALHRRLEQLPINRKCFGFIHNDPHVQNILYDEARIILLDFDVANYHWFACDIAIAFQAMLFMKTGGMERPLVDRRPLLNFLRDFKAGYEQENHLDPYWWTQIDLFIHYRRMLLFTVMQDWLDTVPETRATWKEMILSEPPILVEE
jgi:amicoumacin kinase